MSRLARQIDELEGTALEQPGGLTWAQMQALAALYAAWHGDTTTLTTLRRNLLAGPGKPEEAVA